MSAAPDLFFGKGRKPALNQIDPRGTGGSEVDVETRTFRQPIANRGSFVGAVVVHDEMHVETRGNGLVDGVQKPAKLRAAMPAMKFSHDFARLYIQSGKQRGGAMSFVITGSAFDLTRAHGQQWLCAVECLNLRLLIDTQHQRPVGWVEVESGDVTDLLDKERILRQLAGLAAMGLQKRKRGRSGSLCSGLNPLPRQESECSSGLRRGVSIPA